MERAWPMGGEQKEFAVNLTFSMVLHFLIFAVVFLTPSLSTHRFQVPVSYTVTLVGPSGGARAAPPRATPAPAEVPSPRVSPPPSKPSPPPKEKAVEAKPPPASPESLSMRKTPEPGKPRPRGAEAPAPPAAVGPPAVAQAPVQAALPTTRGGAGAPGVIAESSVSTENADPSLGYYLTAIQAKVSGRWVEPSLGLAAGQAERVTVRFTVLRSGLVRDIQVLSASRNVFLDQSALRAVQEAVPLPPFPPLYSEETLVVHFHFVMRGE